ncbi:hypothetical protein AAU61_15195 [Desulfocarbo indianensis]|nr:hypothetical protein AAU61_15195 [Desulfocarbo indianensis]
MNNHTSADGPAAQPNQAGELRLFNRGLVLIVLAVFLVFCNMAVFFEFYDYLKYLRLPAASQGIIIGVFSLVALIVRPLLSIVLNPSNAKAGMIVGAAGVVVSLFLYGLVDGVAGMLAVRVVHGLFYVLLAASEVAALVAFIPEKRSGQAFGFLAIVTILPYAVVPPLAEAVHATMAEYPRLLAGTGLLMILLIPLALLVPSPKKAGARREARLTWSEVAENLKDRRILALLGAALMVYAAFTVIFYFVNSFAHSRGVADIGWFFTLATGMEILVRIVGGRLFDRLSKTALLGAALLVLAAAYLGLTQAASLAGFLGLALVFGLGWGVAFPMITALLFDFSTPRLRPLNTNLGYQMFQGGFFLGPLLGAWLLPNMKHGGLFIICAAACLAGAALISLLALRKGAN